MVGPALARRAAGARTPPGPSGCVPRRAAPRCRSSHDGKAPDSEPGEEWERNYERHVARKPEIFPLPRTEEERMRRSEALHEWHEHQYRMLELVSKLQTASLGRQED